jgi:hypothetical protein
MLKKSSDTAQGRLLSLFSILDDWLEAPKLEKNSNNHPPQSENKLLEYLALEAAKAGAEMPEMLAHQLYFMAIAAAQEKLSNNKADSFAHAKLAAQALISAQKQKKTFVVSRKAIYASAASMALIAGITSVILFANLQKVQPQQTVALNSNFNQANIKLASNHDINAASPSQTAALFARIEQMRKGNCQLIEAIQLPDAYKKIYFENIVMGQISSNREDQRIVNNLLTMVRCNYTPMLMANSIN